MGILLPKVQIQIKKHYPKCLAYTSSWCCWKYRGSSLIGTFCGVQTFLPHRKRLTRKRFLEQYSGHPIPRIMDKTVADIRFRTLFLMRRGSSLSAHHQRYQSVQQTHQNPARLWMRMDRKSLG